MIYLPIFEKWPKHAVGPNFFTGNMWNLNQMSPLNKMIPLAEVDTPPP